MNPQEWTLNISFSQTHATVEASARLAPLVRMNLLRGVLTEKRDKLVLVNSGSQALITLMRPLHTRLCSKMLPRFSVGSTTT